VANAGWTWDQALDGLTVPRYLALQAEWRARPPAHWLLAVALKYRLPDSPQTSARQPTLDEMRAAFPSGRL
jgi:hypothetical protein